MRISICWPLISGYMSACWRALAALPGVELKVLAWRPAADRDHISFDQSVVEGLDVRLLDAAERTDAALIRRQVLAHHPHLLVVPGWFWKPYREQVYAARRQEIPVIMAMDTSLDFSARQFLGRWARASYFRQVSGVYVSGERAYQLARWLGFRQEQVMVGCYGFDFPAFAGCLDARLVEPTGWPRSFLYVGRYVERKGLDTLLEAYDRYRRETAQPWSLTCCGQGPLQPRLAAATGIVDRGFVQPEALPAVMVEAGTFVLPSRFEAWGVALAEAGAAGLPLIASRSVGAGVELLRDFYNGRLFDTGDAGQLAAAMRWVHDHVDQAAALGERSRTLAEPFRADLWAEKLLALGRQVQNRGR